MVTQYFAQDFELPSVYSEIQTCSSTIQETSYALIHPFPATESPTNHSPRYKAMPMPLILMLGLAINTPAAGIVMLSPTMPQVALFCFSPTAISTTR